MLVGSKLTALLLDILSMNLIIDCIRLCVRARSIRSLCSIHSIRSMH